MDGWVLQAPCRLLRIDQDQGLELESRGLSPHLCPELHVKLCMSRQPLKFQLMAALALVECEVANFELSSCENPIKA